MAQMAEAVEKRGQARPPPSIASEAETDAGHQLVAREVVLVVGVAIFGQDIDVVRQGLLGADAETHAIAIAGGVIAGQVGADAAVGIADLGIDIGFGRQGQRGAATDIQVTAGRDAVRTIAVTRGRTVDLTIDADRDTGATGMS
jgi:hypothetical protein